MKKYIVYYEQTNDLNIEVEAENEAEANEKADEILNKFTFIENVEKCQQGCFEHTYTDEDKE